MENNKDPYPRFLKKKPPSGNIFDELFIDNHINTLTVIIKKECLDRMKGFDESKELIGIEDYELWLRVALFYKIGFLDKIIAVYRIHDSNITNEINDIKSQGYLIYKFEQLLLNLKKDCTKVISKKREKLFFRWACYLMENKEFDAAKEKFISSTGRNHLIIHSILGIISCLLKTNILFKSRRTALNYKHYGNYLSAKGDYQRAKIYFLASIKLYPLQKLALKSLF